MLKRERNAAPLNSPFLPSCKKFQVQFESNKNKQRWSRVRSSGHIWPRFPRAPPTSIRRSSSYWVCWSSRVCRLLGYLNLNAAFLQHPVTVKFSSQAIFLEPTGYGSAQHSISVLSYQAKWHHWLGLGSSPSWSWRLVALAPLLCPLLLWLGIARLQLGPLVPRWISF